MAVEGVTTIGLIGAGDIGSQLARLAVAGGYRVVISNSRSPETLADLVEELGPEARAATSAEAGEAGDLVVVAVPLKAIDRVPVAPLRGKVVIDTNNYYPARDGRIGPLDDNGTTTSELLQQHLPDSRVVKAFNHIMAPDLTAKAAPAGTPGRRALAVWGDDDAATGLVATIIDAFGFDAVVAGPLADSWRIERDQPGYVSPDDAAQLRRHLAEATRDRNG